MGWGSGVGKRRKNVKVSERERKKETGRFAFIESPPLSALL